jgi:hypothetical protein
MLRYKHVAFLDPDPDRIRTEFRAGERTYARLFSLFLIHFAEREGKPRWGAQTGLIERYADQMFDAYQGLKVIHMIRDPRDRYEASISKWPNGKLRAGGATARFIYSARLAERNRRTHPDDYLIVRFEDMVRQPESTVSAVCAFLGITFDPAMLDLPAAPKLRSELIASGGAEGPLLSEEFIGAFADKVPVDDVAFIQLHARKWMRAHGYEPVPVFETAGGWARFIASGWLGQAARMAIWLAVEFGQQRFPRIVPRRFGNRMIVEPKTGVS